MRKYSTSSNSSMSSASFSLPENPPIDPKLLLERTHMYNTKYPLFMLIKAAHGILNNATSYENEGAREDAFILYSRFVDLVANQIPDKPEFKISKMAFKKNPNSTDGKVYREFTELLPQLASAMEKSERIMNDLKREFNEYKKLENARQEIRDLQKRKFNELKEKEQRDYLERTSHFQRRKSSMQSDDTELLKKLRSLSDGSSKAFTRLTDLELPAYPTINDVAITEDDKSLQSQFNLRQGRTPSFGASPPGAIDKLSKSFQQAKISKETTVTHKSVNFTEGGAPMRTVFLPADLSEHFLKIADSNTHKNLETCGILVGKLNRNAFFITHLLIPDQDSTTDTCSTRNEEKMFEYIEQEDPDLFILGWIHTHPTQSCFMSSVDLHTQNSYQIMLNEAIAIVCSPDPKFNKKIGIFRLTDPPGVPTITNCSKSGFHPHNEPNLYVDCNRLNNRQIETGHVVIRNELPFKIKDLR